MIKEFLKIIFIKRNTSVKDRTTVLKEKEMKNVKSIEEFLNTLPTENKLQKFSRLYKNIKNIIIVLYTLCVEKKKNNL
jgi:hypothetical protein